jgi:hypothetical protein
MEMAMAILPECNSTEPWRPMGKYLDLLVLPLVCFCGLFLNLACIVVFIKRSAQDYPNYCIFYYLPGKPRFSTIPPQSQQQQQLRLLLLSRLNGIRPHHKGAGNCHQKYVQPREFLQMEVE